MSGTTARVGLIGTGAMGARFARRLADRGYQVGLWNRTPAKAQAVADSTGRTVTVHRTARELAESVDVVITMVWDSDALEAVAHGPDGFIAGLGADTTVVDMSTVEPEVSQAVARAVEQAGAQMIDAPVSGSLDAAAAGTVVVMASGPEAALESARGVLDSLSRTVLYVGPEHGAGLVMKLAINLQVAIQAVAFGEALALAATYGVARQAAIDIMMQSVIASPMLRYRVPFVTAPPDEVWASAAQLRKDVAYAVRRTRGASLGGNAAEQLLDAVVADGRGDAEAAELIIEAARLASGTHGVTATCGGVS